MFRLKCKITFPYDLEKDYDFLEWTMDDSIFKNVISFSEKRNYMLDTYSIAVCARKGKGEPLKRGSTLTFSERACNTPEKLCADCYWDLNRLDVHNYLN